MRHIKAVIRLAVLLAAASIMAAGGPAAAETRTWTGGVDHQWYTAGNWTPAASPVAADDLYIYSGSPQATWNVYVDDGGSITFDGPTASGTFDCASFGIGYDGTGSLNIINGGQVESSGGGSTIGKWSGSTGTVTVDNGTWTNSGYLVVGYHGRGELSISDGGQVANAYGSIGYFTGSTGTVTVDNGTWTNTRLFVGLYGGSGELTISNGGQVANAYGSIGYFTGSTGTVTVDGAGSSWSNSGSLYVGGSASGAGGTGNLIVSNDGTVNIGDTLKVWGPGTVNLLGGTLAAGTIDHTAGGAFNFTGGTLHVGTFQGNLTNAGGTLAPGSSPGTTVVTGDYTQQAGGALEIEIVGTAPGQWDVLDVTGTANLDGTLEVVLDGYSPAAGDSFAVMTYASRSGEFADTTGWQFGGNKALVKVYGPNALTLFATYQGDATLDYCVDGLDYVAWSNNYLTGDTWQEGDLNADGITDGLDYVIWSNNYLQGLPASPGAVPEPSSALVLALGFLALRRRFGA